jgi:hypothetical protein
MDKPHWYQIMTSNCPAVYSWNESKESLTQSATKQVCIVSGHGFSQAVKPSKIKGL